MYLEMGLHNALDASRLEQLLPQSLPGVFIVPSQGSYRDSLLAMHGSLLFVGSLLGFILNSEEYITEKMAYKILTCMMIVITCVFSYKYL